MPLLRAPPLEEIDLSGPDPVAVDSLSALEDHAATLRVLQLDRLVVRNFFWPCSFPACHTLWLNNAILHNAAGAPRLSVFLPGIARHFPALRFLSLFNCAPWPSGADEEGSRRARLLAIARLPTLLGLNGTPVTPAEREEAAAMLAAPASPAKDTVSATNAHMSEAQQRALRRARRKQKEFQKLPAQERQRQVDAAQYHHVMNAEELEGEIGGKMQIG